MNYDAKVITPCQNRKAFYGMFTFPAVKEHLLSFGIERLEQTGKEYIVDGKKIKARKKTNNKWFETQDSISYWEDFQRPKIIWGEISDRSKFGFDEKGVYIPEATTFLMVGKEIPSLFIFLNSSIAEWYFSKLGPRTGEGTIRWKKYTVEQIFAPHLNREIISSTLLNHSSISEMTKTVNELLYVYYGLSPLEKQYIEDFYYTLNKSG